MIPVVLYGQTGCGKTDLIRELQKRDLPVIDLEGLARHRGSVFGRINISEDQPSQQSFNELIDQLLVKYYDVDIIFLEHEATNIGKLRLPPVILRLYDQGIPVFIQAALERRVQQILLDYLPAEKNELMRSLNKLQERLTPEFYAEQYKLLETGRYAAFCSNMLTYYDQAKQYQPVNEYAYVLQDRGTSTNADELLKWITHHVAASERTTGSTLS